MQRTRLSGGLCERAGRAILIGMIALGLPAAARAQSMEQVFSQWNDQFNAGHYREAERTARWMVDQSQTQGWLAASLNCVGRAQHEQGHYQEADETLRRALAIALDESNINRGWIPGNLGRTCAAEKKYDDAERFYNQALKEFGRLRGAESRESALVLRNFGWMYHDRAQYETSEKYHLRALAIRTVVLGPDDSAVGDSLNALGDLSRHLKRYDQAKERLERSIAILEKSLGPEHADVAGALKNLAAVYRDKADYSRAEALGRRVLKIQEKAFGRDSAAVALTLNELADDVEKQKRAPEAKQLREQSQAMAQRTARRPDPSENPFHRGQRISISVEQADLKDGSEVVGSVPQGSVFEVKQIDGQWCRIDGKVGDKAIYGWIHSRDATLAAAAAPGPRPLPEGKPFTSREGGFAVSLPGVPKRLTLKVNGIEGFVYTVQAGHGTYSVNYCDPPQGVSRFIQTAIQGYVQGKRGHVVSDKAVQLDDLYPGQDVLIRLPDDSYARLTVYAVKNRQYQVLLEGPKNAVTSKEADAFFDSFKLE